MIAECMIFLAAALPASFDETSFIKQHLLCDDTVPAVMQEYAEYYVEHFDEENIDTAVRIGWCESRGKQSAYRNDNGDSGVMQFVSWTWNWVAEKYDMPKWNTYVLKYNGRPYTENKVSRSSAGFEMIKVQFSPYYNIKMASLLAEDIYGRTQWRDWSSSKWCWEEEEKWSKRWQLEESW